VGVPDTVMGLTFVAAGVSVPDALSSLAVLKDGELSASFPSPAYTTTTD